jgi:hypothetical protein
LVLAVFPLIIKDHFVSLCRIDGRLARATVITATGGVLELTGAAAGALLGGLAGLCLGWAAVMCIEAVLMASTVYRAALGRRSSASWATVDETGSTQNRTTP